MPNSPFNIKSFERAGGTVRVDLELPGVNASRPLVLPQLSGPARLVQDLLFIVPTVLGLVHDEQTLRLAIVRCLKPEELLSAANSAGAAAASAEASANVLLRVTPAIVVRSAQLSFTLRPAGPLGRLLSSFFGFVPICALALYRSRFLGICGVPGNDESSSHETSSPDGLALTYVERQMLSKGLAGVDGAVSAHFTQTLAAFESEDRSAHNGILRGYVQLDQLAKITNMAGHEWKTGFDEQEMQRIVLATLELPQSPGGLVTPDGRLKYRQWLAIATVAMLCGGRELVDYADWVARNETKQA